MTISSNNKRASRALQYSNSLFELSAQNGADLRRTGCEAATQCTGGTRSADETFRAAQRCAVMCAQVLIFVTMQRRRDAAAPMNKDGRIAAVDRHDRSFAEQSSEHGGVALFFAPDGDDAHGGGLGVDDADRDLVGDDRGDDLLGHVSRYRDHIQSDRADGGHRFEFFDGEDALACGGDHACVFRDGNERARQSADVAACHDAALFDGVVEHRKRRRGAARAHALQPYLFEDMRDRVADRRGRGERQVDDAAADAEAFCGFGGDQLPDAGDLERGLFDDFGDLCEVALDLFQRDFDDSGTGDADVDDAVVLARAEERARHKGVVLDRVGEHDQLGAGDAVLVASEVGGAFEDAAHQADGVHIDACFRGGDVDGRAHFFGGRERFGDALDELALIGGHRLVDEGGVAAEEVDAYLFCRAVERAYDLYMSAACGRDEADRGDGHALVDDGDADLFGDGVAHVDETAGGAHDLVVDLGGGAVGVVGDAVEQRDPQRDRPHVEVLSRDHIDRFENFFGRVHITWCRCGASRRKCP